MSPKMITWIDLETTGLDMTGEPKIGGEHQKLVDEDPMGPKHYVSCRAPDRILEVAVIVTDDKLREVARDSWVTNEARHYDVRTVSPEVRAMHTANGLWVESLASPFSIDQIDVALAGVIERAGAKGSPIAGNTIRFDREFIRKWMPKSLELLHYRDLNVSTLVQLAEMFWPDVYKNRPGERASDKNPDGRPQGPTHRALPDVLSSIAQMRYYLTQVGPKDFIASIAPDGALVIGSGFVAPAQAAAAAPAPVAK